ncbi:MAG: hypothetical protein PHY54_19440 [Methylococcales bacterium]|nr:hypothetical protein [Methylococcales bacterium]
MLTAFRDMILPAVRVDFSIADGILILKESASDSKVKKLYIQGIPEHTFAFTLDYQPAQHARCFKQLSCYVDPANGKGINKGCDLVVVTYKNDKWQILVLDMKSDKPNISETGTQLLNSELYVRYIVSMLKHHYEIDTSVINYQRTMVTTGTRGIRKEAIYKPNDAKPKKNSFHAVQVQSNKHEAKVHLGKLLGNS